MTTVVAFPRYLVLNYGQAYITALQMLKV